MTLVRRYFAFAPAGTGDGTTFANRAALFSSGNWSSIITGFDFSGTDSLEAYIVNDGVHACSQELESSLWASTPPTRANPLHLIACDNTGARWVPPNPGWVSAQPAWNDSGMPVIATTTNVRTISLHHTNLYGLKLTASGSSGSVTISVGQMNWCIIENSQDATGAGCVGDNCTQFLNSVARLTGDNHGIAVNVTSTITRTVQNVRVEGNPAAVGGGRHGFRLGSNRAYEVGGLVAIDCLGSGVVRDGNNAGNTLHIKNGVFYNCGIGINISGTTQTTYPSQISGCVIVDCTEGIDVSAGSGGAIVTDSRLRDNTSNFDMPANFTEFAESGVNLLSAGTDAAEFVDAAGGDFRIKATSTLWGKGYGAGDEIPTPGDIADAVWAYVDRTLT